MVNPTRSAQGQPTTYPASFLLWANYPNDTISAQSRIAGTARDGLISTHSTSSQVPKSLADDLRADSGRESHRCAITSVWPRRRGERARQSGTRRRGSAAVGLQAGQRARQAHPRVWSESGCTCVLITNTKNGPSIGLRASAAASAAPKPHRRILHNRRRPSGHCAARQPEEQRLV